MSVRRLCVVIAMLFLTVGGSKAAKLQYAFRVGFTDKNGSPSLSNPLSFLSQRALDRRSQQGLALDSTDRPVNTAYIDSVLTITGGKLHHKSKWFNHVVILVQDSSKILLLAGKPYVQKIEFVAHYDFILHLKPRKGDSTFSLKNQLGKTTAFDQSYYGQTWTQNKLVNGPALHNLGFRGAGVIIAVFDGGFKGTDTHPGFDSMRQNGRLLDLYDFTLNKKDTVYRYDTHGTNCLSAIAGVIPGSYVGAAPDASYVLYRTEDSSSEQPIEMDNMLAGLERADSVGVDVVSSSLGYRNFDSEWYTLTVAERDGKSTIAAKAVNMAAKKGIFFVSSAGNDGGSGILTPGDADSALCVGNVNSQREPAGSSGVGPNGAGVVKADIGAIGNFARIFGGNGDISGGFGTSFAVPQIAGWVACLRQAKPNASIYAIRQAIIKSAHLYPGVDTNKQIGYGVPDFEVALKNLDPIDIDTVNTNNFIYLFPNPVTDKDQLKLLVSSNVAQKMQLALYDISGRRLWTSQNQLMQGRQYVTVTIPTRIPTGMYLLQAIADTQQQTVKLLKN